MSECQIKRNFCMTHKCWVSVQDDTACPMSALAAEVERLTALLKAADDVVASQDRRIEKALAYCDDWKPIAFAWSIQRILRGES